MALKTSPNTKWIRVRKSIAGNLSQTHVETYPNRAVFECFRIFIYLFD